MSKCWKWRPSSRPSFATLVSLLEKGIDKLDDVDYVNLAEIVLNAVDNEVSLQKSDCCYKLLLLMNTCNHWRNQKWKLTPLPLAKSSRKLIPSIHAIKLDQKVIEGAE